MLGTVRHLRKKGKHKQRNSVKGYDDAYKSAARMVGMVPKLSKKGKHDYKTAAGCQDGPALLQNYSDIGRDGVELTQEKLTEL